MTRQEILDNYEVDANGIIRSPGKFEGEPLYVPYFWERGLEGCADCDDGKVYGFEITNEDCAMFPELEGINTLALEESESGFVNRAEYQSLAIMERELEESCEDEESEDDTDYEDEDESGPDEDAITTSDHKNFYQYGRLVLSIDEDADYKAELRSYMESQQFFPDCWFISDHGNAHLIEFQPIVKR